MTYSINLNGPQLSAVKTTQGPLLILAGAGTGKTRVITSRIAYLLREGVPASRILALTFTNKAAREMNARVNAIVNASDSRGLTISTFHALCVRILRQEAYRVGYKSNFSIYDENDSLSLIRKIIPKESVPGEKLEPSHVRTFISNAKNESWQFSRSGDDLFDDLFERYQEELKKCNAMDFDDLLCVTARLFTQFEQVRTNWQRHFGFIMVDEFQDTNTLQLEIVRLLSDEHRNVCVVGDDDQSIYSWRGAQIQNILEFDRFFSQPKIVKLEQNYRSTNCILGTANSIIRRNPRRQPKLLWSENGAGEKVRLLEIPDDLDEAQYVIDAIREAHRSDGAKWSDFGVLFRMNAQSRLFEEQLRRARIPYRIVGGRSFFDRREIKDLLAYLTSLANREDDISLLRIINTPPRGIGVTTIDLAVQESSRSKTPLYYALRSRSFLDGLSKRARAAVEKFTKLMDVHEARLLAPLANFSSGLSDLLSEIGYDEGVRQGCKSPEEAANRRENVAEMVRALSEYQSRDGGEGITGFLSEISLDQELNDEETEEDAVTLITFHAAKGLEFKHVFLIGVEEGLIPHQRSRLEGNLDEERRLFYVGITRAMHKLTITYCQRRMMYGRWSCTYRSSFLEDMDPKFVEEIDFMPAANGTARSPL